MDLALYLTATASDQRVFAYAVFLALIAVFLALDLGVFHREVREISFKESIFWSVIWFLVAIAFMPLIVVAYDHHWLGLGLDVPKLGGSGATETVAGSVAAKQYFTGYMLERALAMDNTFVIALVFSALGIPNQYQHRVLFWGILGAVIMRGLMIYLGAQLVANVSWVIYVFAAILVFTALKMAFEKEGNNVDPSQSTTVKLLKKILPISDHFDGARFFTKIDGRRMATPLFVALVLVEVTDLVFAVDSIPAIFSISADPFILFTSNIFAILGLRALYFCVAALLARFRFLKPALIVVLLFVGLKMFFVHSRYHIDETASMFVVVGILMTGAVASAVLPEKNGQSD